MKKFLLISAIVCSTMFSNAQVENTTPVAFPGAEGHGRFTTGGRGGQVIYVTNLNDSGAGSLRAAINQSGKRIIVFKVSGIIELSSELNIFNGDITIAGQTAPGDGICLKNYPLKVSANNVIIRYIRSRMGDAKGVEGDAMWGRNQSDIILDHCTLSWSTDETGSFYDNQNFTMQWCILAESLRESVHGKGTHGYGGIWGGQKASFHHNLLIHHDSRNPRVNGSRYSGQPDLELVDLRNNVIYNWGGNSAYAGEGGSVNFVNNYYKSGDATSVSVKDRIFAPNMGVDHAFIYANGNYVHGYQSVTEDNWLGIDPQDGLSDDDVRSTTEFNKGQITTHIAEAAFHRVLDYAGTSLSRDIHDQRYAEEAKSGTTTYSGSKTTSVKPGLIDTPSDAGGWPTYSTTTAPTDTDNDGMPDDWEDANGLNKADAADNINYDLSLFYTNVEVYINSLVDHITYAGIAGGESNYIDKAFSTDATITAEGSSTLDAVENMNVAITEITYSFANATGATVSGLPDGVEASVTSNTVTISGTPTEYGDFVVAISTTGTSNPATVSGTMTVHPPAASISVSGTDNSSQTMVIGESLQDITLTWTFADDISVDGLPSGVRTLIDLEGNEVTIYGTPKEVGTFEYTVTTVGNPSNATFTGTIEVTNPLAVNDKVISIALFPNPLVNDNLSIEVANDNVIKSVSILNLSGQQVLNESGNNKSTMTIDVHLAAGLYHVLLETKQGIIKEKLIIK